MTEDKLIQQVSDISFNCIKHLVAIRKSHDFKTAMTISQQDL